MDSIAIRTVLVATDLTEGSDRLIRTASAIAALNGAALHVVHVHLIQTEPFADWAIDPARADEAIRGAERALDEQVSAAIPAHSTPSTLTVLVGEAPSEVIRGHAQDLSADLIVIGPHGGALSDHPFLGTTADRLVRTVQVPCLVVRAELAFPLRSLGVLVDFSPASQRALETATAWAEAYSGRAAAAPGSGVRPLVSVAHIAWSEHEVDPVEMETRVYPELERAIERVSSGAGGEPDVEYQPTVLRPGAAQEVVERWVRALKVPMVVMGTRGGSRLPYAYLGGLASTVARTAPCSVLLVPPREVAASNNEPEARTRLGRVVTGVDFHESSWEAALWVMRHFAPEAGHELVHVVDVPELPGPLRALGSTREQLRLAARAGAYRRLEELRDLGNSPTAGVHITNGKPAAELIRLAGEVGAAMVVVGQQGPRHGLSALLGSTAERILFQSPIPVLLARKVGDGPPARLLVAIDSSEVADRVLDWMSTLLSRFGAVATVINVVDRLLLADELVGLPSADALHDMEKDSVKVMQEWLDEKLHQAGVASERVMSQVSVGDPSYEIIAAARRTDVDLVIIGSRGDDIARTPLIGRIVNKVVRSAPCAVLVVAPGRVPLVG